MSSSNFTVLESSLLSEGVHENFSYIYIAKEILIKGM